MRATKQVVLETGAVLEVPAFVEVGDVVKVDTRTGRYVARIPRADRGRS